VTLGRLATQAGGARVTRADTIGAGTQGKPAARARPGRDDRAGPGLAVGRLRPGPGHAERVGGGGLAVPGAHEHRGVHGAGRFDPGLVRRLFPPASKGLRHDPGRRPPGDRGRGHGGGRVLPLRRELRRCDATGRLHSVFSIPGAVGLPLAAMVSACGGLLGRAGMAPHAPPPASGERSLSSSGPACTATPPTGRSAPRWRAGRGG
jgi:hypothetical protein